MKTRTLTILNVVNWIAIIAGVLLFVAGYFEGGGGAVSGLATTLALTGMLWAPVLIIVAVVSFVLEVRFMKLHERPWQHLLKIPSTYVLLFILYMLSVMLLA